MSTKPQDPPEAALLACQRKCKAINRQATDAQKLRDEATEISEKITALNEKKQAALAQIDAKAAAKSVVELDAEISILNGRRADLEEQADTAEKQIAGDDLQRLRELVTTAASAYLKRLDQAFEDLLSEKHFAQRFREWPNGGGLTEIKAAISRTWRGSDAVMPIERIRHEGNKGLPDLKSCQEALRVLEAHGPLAPTGFDLILPNPNPNTKS